MPTFSSLRITLFLTRSSPTTPPEKVNVNRSPFSPPGSCRHTHPPPTAQGLVPGPPPLRVSGTIYAYVALAVGLAFCQGQPHSNENSSDNKDNIARDEEREDDNRTTPKSSKTLAFLRGRAVAINYRKHHKQGYVIFQFSSNSQFSSTSQKDVV